MTLLPVADSARLLGIHPKTLHHWLKEANRPLATHPTPRSVSLGLSGALRPIEATNRASRRVFTK
jgi:transposase-like protein